MFMFTDNSIDSIQIRSTLCSCVSLFFILESRDIPCVCAFHFKQKVRRQNSKVFFVPRVSESNSSRTANAFIDTAENFSEIWKTCHNGYDVANKIAVGFCEWMRMMKKHFGKCSANYLM